MRARPATRTLLGAIAAVKGAAALRHAAVNVIGARLRGARLPRALVAHVLAVAELELAVGGRGQVQRRHPGPWAIVVAGVGRGDARIDIVRHLAVCGAVRKGAVVVLVPRPHPVVRRARVEDGHGLAALSVPHGHGRQPAANVNVRDAHQRAQHVGAHLPHAAVAHGALPLVCHVEGEDLDRVGRCGCGGAAAALWRAQPAVGGAVPGRQQLARRAGAARPQRAHQPPARVVHARGGVRGRGQLQRGAQAGRGGARRGLEVWRHLRRRARRAAGARLGPDAHDA